jgi:hypothetical protein
MDMPTKRLRDDGMTWTKTRMQGMKIGIAWTLGSATMLLLCACLSGCVGKGNDNTTIPVSTQVDTYVGTQHTTGTYEGVYGLTVDHTTNYFNIADVSSYSIGGDFNYVGNLTAASPQFQNMNITDPAPLAVTPLMLEVPGDAAVVELYFEGYLPPVVFAASSGCQAVAGATTYQLIQLDDGLTENYGTITVNRGQSDWTFSNFDLLQIDGTDNKPAALNPGACAQSAEGFATTIPVTVLGLPLTYTVAISPNGYLIMDRDEGEAPTVVRSANVPLQPLIGVVQPSSPLNTSSLIAANYAGFEYDGAAASPQVSGFNSTDQPISFSGSNATQTQMVGGTFPNGDPTQTPGTGISVNLGTQDPKNNGLYPSAAVTFPDPASRCVGTPYGGTSASGNPTCTFQAVAVAGNPGGKYVVYLTVMNPFGNNIAPVSTIQFLLYQQ